LPKLTSMYTIVGADQREYGPVTEEQLRQWIAEGRANGQTVVRSGDGPWKRLSEFPEFGAAFGQPPPPPASQVPPSLPAGSMIGAPPPTNGMAIGGVVCGVLGLFCCGPVFSTLALVFSLIGLSQINQNPARYSGKGVAVAGIVLSIVGYLLFVILLLTGFISRAVREFPSF
jgi:hypothetical protein